MSRAVVVGLLRRQWPSDVVASVPSLEPLEFLDQPSGLVLKRSDEGKCQRLIRMADQGCDVPEEGANHVSSKSRRCSPIWRLLWNQPPEEIRDRRCVGQAKGYVGLRLSCVRRDMKSARNW